MATLRTTPLRLLRQNIFQTTPRCRPFPSTPISRQRLATFSTTVSKLHATPTDKQSAAVIREEDDKGRRFPPQPPHKEDINLRTGVEAPSFLGTKKRLPEFNLVDRVVLISGAARGLGLTQAEALLEAGATVYCLDRVEKPSEDFYNIQRRAEEELGTQLHYRQIDVTNESALQEVVHKIGESHGRLDGLIAAAGINKEGDALEYSADDFNRIMQVNVTGAFSTAQAVARQMVKYGNGGSIVMIASMSGTVANRGLICAAYNASKAAVIQLGRNLASEWGPHGIRVNTISPGYIVTPMTKHDFKSSPDREHFLADGNMLGRLSMPSEYRGAAVFLVSNASSFMTGSDLIMDGGHHSW